MKTYKVTIQGSTPLLMNRYPVEAMLANVKGATRSLQVHNHKIEAERAAYWTTSGKKELCIPGIILYSAILAASSFHKINKRSARSILAGAIRITGTDGLEEIRLGTSDYVVDIRPVVIQRARILKARARLDKWGATFHVTFDERLIPDFKQFIEPILIETGHRIGICDFRPWFKIHG